MMIFDYLEKAKELESFSGDDAKELGQMLQTKSFQRLMAIIAQEVSYTMDGCLGWNLNTPAGIADAANSQGRARGLRRALDIIWEKAAIEKETD